MSANEVKNVPDQSRRAAIGSFVGTTLEWYDFFIYGTLAALVFGPVFFPEQDGVVGTLAAFATFAVGFAARPLGSIIFGHFGDRIGRKNMLVLTLMIMGISTVLIGCIPSYAQIGVWGPVLLVLFRVLQGVALGGEWGGAALMSVEHAPDRKKGIFGSATQMGSPAGSLLAVIVIAIVANSAGDGFNEWGWRIPFWASTVIVLIGLYIRAGITESHDFEVVKKADALVKLPIGEVLRHNWKNVLVGAGLGAANNAIYYMVAVYTLAYATGTLGLPKTDILNHLTIVSAFYLVSIPFFGWLSDRIGLRRQVVYAALLSALFVIPYFMMIDSGNPIVILLAMIIGLAVIQSAAYAPQPAIYSELFPAKIRYTGASLSYALPTTLIGGTTPFIATWLFAVTKSNFAMAGYIIALSLIAALCAEIAHRRHRKTPAAQELLTAHV